MTDSEVSAAIENSASSRISLLDTVMAFGVDAVVARIATLHLSGCRHAARAMERELNELDVRLSECGAFSEG